MSKPRHIYLLKTEHFEFLFSEPSSNTVKFLADNAERLYNLAKSEIPEAHDFNIPVVISPDSDRLSVDYTPHPYNRIVIFDGVPEKNENVFQNTLLGLFYHEVYMALSQTVRDPVNQFIAETIGGAKYQPISLFYLPFSFVEGRAFLEEGQDLNVALGEGDLDVPGDVLAENGGGGSDDVGDVLEENSEIDNSDNYLYGRFSDRVFLEILSIAKYEGKFPNWIQAGTDRDIYPGRILNEAAGSAFAAYLMQAYGVEKYAQFWNECGKLNFHLTAGMFKKFYGLPLSEIWKNFQDSVPLPDDIEKIKELEKKTKKILSLDSEGLASNLILSDYGLVWYDDIRHEVDILDWNGTILMRRLLFLASDVKKLSLSPDGRYLIVSFYGIKTRPEFRNDKIWIYDLQQRHFVDANFTMRDGVIVKTASGKEAVAGIYVKDKISNIQIYDFEYNEKETNLIFEKKFSADEYPCDLTLADNGNVNFLVYKNNRSFLHQYDFENNEEKSWSILYNGKPVKIKNLRILQAKKTEFYKLKNKNLYVFEYYLPEGVSFSRIGIMLLDENFHPYKVYFQDCDVAGGVNYPVFYSNQIFFCSDKFSHNEINYMPIAELPFIKGGFEEEIIEERVYTTPVNIENKKLGDYELSGYNPLKYMVHFSFIPFMAIKNLATTKKQKLWPSLGGTVITQYDPFMNSRVMLSGSAGYAKLNFSTNTNPTIDDVSQQKKKYVDDDKNINFAISIENTSTPVNIRLGCLFKFNTKGEYNFYSHANAFLQIPIGMAFSKFNFNLYGNYIAATDYYDRKLTEHFPGLSGWPAFNKAYETSKVTFSAEYSNIHQYGISKYEERGFSLGIKLDSFWNITKIRFLNEKFHQKNEKLPGLNHFYENEQFRKNMLQSSQLVLGLFGEIKIPQLTPFSIVNGFVLSLPSSIKIELFNEVGTAVRSSAEILLFGYECQNGIPFLYLYFSRLGLIFGYNIDLNYDTYTIPLPDIRVKNNLWNVFANTYVHDSIYFIYNMDFSPAVGYFSEYHMNLTMKAEYFLRSKGFAFSLDFLVYF